MTATLKTTVIQEPSASVVNLTLGTNGSVTLGQNLTVTGTMPNVQLAGSSSGTTTLQPAAVASGTITLPAGTGTAAVQGVSTNIVSGTAQNSTSGTSIDFTGIPSWAKRITVMFNQVTLSGAANLILQIGTSGGVETSGYNSVAGDYNGVGIVTNSFNMCRFSSAGGTFTGMAIISNLTGNTWVSENNITSSGTASTGSGGKTLAGVLDRVRVTNDSTNTFTGGTINIMWE
jgi:hypothetical protein